MSIVFNTKSIIIASLLYLSNYYHIIAAELDICQVGQANFTILKSETNALIVDCGYGSGVLQENWIEKVTVNCSTTSHELTASKKLF